MVLSQLNALKFTLNVMVTSLLRTVSQRADGPRASQPVASTSLLPGHRPGQLRPACPLLRQTRSQPFLSGVGHCMGSSPDLPQPWGNGLTVTLQCPGAQSDTEFEATWPGHLAQSPGPHHYRRPPMLA